MSFHDTIAAIASPPGRSPRAVIRLSGAATHAVLQEVLDRVVRGPGPARLCLGPGLELPCLVLPFHAPRSYTGEDAAELQIPGNPCLAERVLTRLLSVAGTPARQAGPGEFTARAYLNGKLTLAQGEGVAALIAAGNDDELRAARELSSGRAGDAYRRWADEAVLLLALVEAGIDFTDQEDVVAIAPGALRARLTSLSAEMRATLGAASGNEAAPETPVVVLAGAPNAGKSTLFNALLGRRRAVESPEAGTTRDALAERIDLSPHAPGGGEVMLVDLAGLDERDARGIGGARQDRARTEIARADVVVQCDPSGRFAPLPGTARATIRVRTKADLPAPGGGGAEQLAVCAMDAWNLGALRRAIADAAWGARSGARATLPARHRRAVGAAIRALDAAAELSPELRARPELVARLLRDAADAFAELVGRISADDVLGRVFATFCVGK